MVFSNITNNRIYNNSGNNLNLNSSSGNYNYPSEASIEFIDNNNKNKNIKNFVVHHDFHMNPNAAATAATAAMAVNSGNMNFNANVISNHNRINLNGEYNRVNTAKSNNGEKNFSSQLTPIFWAKLSADKNLKYDGIDLLENKYQNKYKFPARNTFIEHKATPLKHHQPTKSDS